MNSASADSPLPQVAITFALPDESRDFVHLLRVQRKSGSGVGSWLEAKLGQTSLLVWHVGIGHASAREQTRRLLEHAQPELLIAAGYAGALQEGLNVGDIVVDLRSNNAPAGCESVAALKYGRIFTQDRVIEGTAEKERLGREQDAIAVDMETDAIEQECASLGIPVMGLRSISDRVDQDIPVPMGQWFDMVRQKPAVFALLAYLAANPRRIGRFVSFVRSLDPARASLAQALQRFIAARE